MFGRRKSRPAAVGGASRAQVAPWQANRAALVEALDAARNIEPATSTVGLILKQGEAVFLEISGAVLVEDQRGPGQWAGGTAGISLPLGSGVPVGLNLGGARGSYTPGQLAPTVLDIGTAWITNERVVFQGSKQVRECHFSNLISVQCDVSLMTIRYSVSNRDTATMLSASFDRIRGPIFLRLMSDRTELALAHYRSQVPELIARLEAELDALDRSGPHSVNPLEASGP